MSDRILIKDLMFEARIGVSDQERSQPQAMGASVEVVLDLSAAGASDAVADTLDYDGLVTAIVTIGAAQPVNLLEHLAERIAGSITTFEGVRSVTVKVWKKDPPVAATVGEIAVEIHRVAL